MANTKNTKKASASDEIKKVRAPRKARTLEERTAELEGKVRAHREIADKFKAELDRLHANKQASEEKVAAAVQMQMVLSSKSKEELEVELAEAEEAAKKLAAIKTALRIKEEPAGTPETND